LNTLKKNIEVKQTFVKYLMIAIVELKDWKIRKKSIEVILKCEDKF